MTKHIQYLIALYIALDRLVEAFGNVWRAVCGKQQTRTEYEVRKLR